MGSMSYANRPFDGDAVAVLGVPYCDPTVANVDAQAGSACRVLGDRWNVDCYIPSAADDLKDAPHGDCPKPQSRHCRNKHLHSKHALPPECDFVEAHRTCHRAEEAFVDNNGEVEAVAVDN